MELWQLKKTIQDKTINTYNIFTGEELGLMDLYIQEMQKVLNCSVERQESVYDYISSGRIKSIIGNVKKLVIIRDDKTFLTQEELWDKFALRKGNIILIYSSVDKRGKFYKRFEDNIVCFDKLDRGILRPKIRSMIGLNDQNIDILLDSCQMSYARILLEIDKLKLFEDTDINKTFTQFVKDGAIYREVPDSIFTFSEAVMRRDRVKSFREYENCKLTAEPNVRLLSVLYNNFRQQIGYQFSKNPTPDNTGLTQFILNICKGRVNKYSNRELVKAMTLLKNIDTGIKTGSISDEQSISYFLSEIL